MTPQRIFAGVAAVVAVSALGIGAAAARPRPAPTTTAAHAKPTTTTTRSVASGSRTTLPKTTRSTFTVVAGRGSTANVRSGPGLAQRIITHLKEGTIVHATGKTALVGGQHWRQIRTSTGTGWMSAALLRPA